MMSLKESCPMINEWLIDNRFSKTADMFQKEYGSDKIPISSGNLDNILCHYKLLKEIFCNLKKYDTTSNNNKKGTERYPVKNKAALIPKVTKAKVLKPPPSFVCPEMEGKLEDLCLRLHHCDSEETNDVKVAEHTSKESAESNIVDDVPKVEPSFNLTNAVQEETFLKKKKKKRREKENVSDVEGDLNNNSVVKDSTEKKKKKRKKMEIEEEKETDEKENNVSLEIKKKKKKKRKREELLEDADDIFSLTPMKELTDRDKEIKEKKKKKKRRDTLEDMNGVLELN